ncbi:MAG: hypothetical protein SFU56_20265 [Capsulimonadales bacterium]|nr:hypothetical protein [Capsulimonadales bacterium]
MGDKESPTICKGKTMAIAVSNPVQIPAGGGFEPINGTFSNKTGKTITVIGVTATGFQTDNSANVVLQQVDGQYPSLKLDIIEAMRGDSSRIPERFRSDRGFVMYPDQSWVGGLVYINAQPGNQGSGQIPLVPFTFVLTITYIDPTDPSRQMDESCTMSANITPPDRL